MGETAGLAETTPGGHVLVIAELGSVHEGSFGNAKRLVDVAAACGVDVVKFQTHIAHAETIRDAPAPPYFAAERRFAYFERTAFTEEQWSALKEHCERQGVEFLSSPFSIEAVELLERIGVQRYKVPSGEVTNLPYLEALAETGKPVLLSSGMSSWAEFDAAVNAVLKRHNRLTVLQCTSLYPCPYERVGLDAMLLMKERYGLPTGLSDHTHTNYAAFAAVALGAAVIEKHLTFSRHMYGSDAPYAAEPEQFADLVRGIRAVEIIRKSRVDKDDLADVREMKTVFEKSIVALVGIPKGSIIDRQMLGIKKPGTGLPPRRHADVVGRRAARDIPADSVIREQDIEWDADENGRGSGPR